MRNYIYGVLSILLLMFSSCNNSKNGNLIIGKWKLIKMDIPALDIASNLKTEMDSITVEGVDTTVKKVAGAIENLSNSLGSLGESLANNAMQGSVFSFEEDGVLSISQLLLSQEGKYSVDKELKEMVVTIDKQDMLFKIMKINDEEMVLKSSFGEEWTFERK